MAAHGASLVPVTERPFNAETAWGALLAPRTPTELFFVRNHFEVPEIEAGEWRLELGGAVRRPRAFSLEELRRRPARRIDVTLECAGNARTTLDPRPVGTPWGLGAVATARFTGTSLADVLASALPESSAVEVLFVGADAGRTKAETEEPYARSLPWDVARDGEALLAWEMNGTPLTATHGFPLRLVVPGWYGMASVKWLREIRVLERPFRGFFQVEDYVFRDRAGTPDGAPVTRMAPRALLVSPRAGESVETSFDVEGVAWSGGGPVVRVEVSVDDGRTWIDAELREGSSPYAACRFRAHVDGVAAGTVSLAARATDAAGAIQPERPIWNRLGYVNNGWHRVEVVAG